MTTTPETRVVPVEPDDNMIDAAKRAWSQKCADVEANYPTEHPDDGGGPMGYAIRAAIAAAPAAPAPEPEPEPVAYQTLTAGKWVECSEFVAKGWGDTLADGCRALYAAPLAPVAASAVEPPYVTHRPLIRNAIALLRMRGGSTDAMRVVRDLEALLQGMPTPADLVSPKWLSIAASADMRDAYVGAREDLAIWKKRALEAEAKLRANPVAASAVDAIQFIEKRRDDYVRDHGIYDPSTGVTEFPGNGDEYVGELEEIIDGLRAAAEGNR